MLKYLLAATAALTLATPVAARAQDVPSYAQQSQDEEIRGRVTAFDGGYDLQVRDERGYLDDVQLHDGTIINPTGITLEPGMIVSVIGANEGDALSADEIDTPYQFDGGVAFYDGRPWAYYGPSFGLAFFFGNTGWWHGDDFGGGFRYAGGARVYGSVNVAFGNRPGPGFGGAGGGAYARFGNGNGAQIATYRHTEPAERAVPSFGAPQPAYRAAQPAYGMGEPAYRTTQPAYRSQPQAPQYRTQPQPPRTTFLPANYRGVSGSVAGRAPAPAPERRSGDGGGGRRDR